MPLGLSAARLRIRSCIWKSCIPRSWMNSSWIRSTAGTQMAELAVALPLLVVFVVGIYDFGTALDTKQKLANAVAEGARIGALTPLNDLSNSLPSSVGGIRNVVSAYLLAAKLNDCGLSTISGPSALPDATWQYVSGGNGCAGSVTLTIQRAYSPAANLGEEGTSGASVKLVSTQVSISYPYAWRFNSVITLLVPGAGYAAVTQITSSATMLDQS